MRTQHLAVTAMMLLLANPSFAIPSRADFVQASSAMSPPAAENRTVTLDLTGMD